jgi:hypothetical protein
MAGSVVSTVSSRKGRGLVRVDCALTCASGAVTAAPIGSFYGRLVGIIYEPTAGAGATMTSTADVALTDAVTGANILTDADFGTARLERPTANIVDNAGAAVSPASTATDTYRDTFVAGKLNLAIANATTTDTGLISLLIEEAV